MSCIPCIPHVFDVHPPIRFMTSWTMWCIKSMHRVVHFTNANIGGSLEGVDRKKMNEHSDDSEVVNNSSEVPDQVQAKKRNKACNKRDATVLEKLKTSSVEDIIQDKMKTQFRALLVLTMHRCPQRYDCIFVEKWGKWCQTRRGRKRK